MPYGDVGGPYFFKSLMKRWSGFTRASWLPMPLHLASLFCTSTILTIANVITRIVAQKSLKTKENIRFYKVTITKKPPKRWFFFDHYSVVFSKTDLIGT